MANAMYAEGKDNLLQGNIDLLTNDLKFDLTDHALDTPAPATDDTLDDIDTGTISSTANLGTKSLTSGVFDAADAVFSSVTDSVECESFSLYYDTGTPSTSLLIAYFDSATGLPITGNGNDVDLIFDSGANKIFNWSG